MRIPSILRPTRFLVAACLAMLGATQIRLGVTAAERERAQQPELVPPIKVTSDAPVTADFRAAHHAWAKRVLLAPRALRGRAEPWEAEARRFMESAVDGLWENEDGRKPTGLGEAGRKLFSAGCRDPLVEFLSARLLFRENGNRRQAQETYQELVKRVQADQEYPRGLLCFIGTDLYRMNELLHDNNKKLGKNLATWTKEAWSDGSYAPNDADLFLEHLLGGARRLVLDEHMQDFDAACTGTALPEWAQRTLHGFVQVKQAWAERGTGWGDDVSPAGQKSFLEHLKKARSEFTAAWKLHPSSPYAPAEMITVAMAAPEEGETVRGWFDRAVAARFDYIPAYRAVCNAYLPRWGGSEELLLAFGRACRVTNRYDTKVPEQFGPAVNDAMNEYRDGREFLRGHPELVEELVEHFRVLSEKSAEPRDKAKWLSLAVINAWAGEKYTAASQALRELPNGLAEDEIGPGAYCVSTSEMLADLALREGEGLAERDAAEKHFAAFELEEARVEFEAALRMAPAAAQPFLRGRVAAIDFEKAFASGEWIRLKPAPGLQDWLVRYGKWHAEPDGTLVNEGHDGMGLIVYRGRVGPEFEFRGEFEIISPTNCCQSLGVTVGYKPPRGVNSIQCTTYQVKRSVILAMPLTAMGGGAGAPQVKLNPVNHFLVRSQSGLVTWELNGKEYLTNYSPDAGTTRLKDGELGFSAPRFCSNNVTKIRNLEVRRLNSAR